MASVFQELPGSKCNLPTEVYTAFRFVNSEDSKEKQSLLKSPGLTL